jgi:hypothetical protein
MVSQETKSLLVIDKAIRALAEVQTTGKIDAGELRDSLSALRWERVRLLKETDTDEYLATKQVLQKTMIA